MLDSYKLYLRQKKFEEKCKNRINNKHNVLQADIIRYTHSIEKGLSIESPKPGFGIKKDDFLLKMLNEWIDNGFSKTDDSILMAISALKEYFEFEDRINFTSVDYLKNKNEFYKFLKKIDVEYNNINSSYGGSLLIESNKFTLEEQLTISQLFKTRHSVRDFSKDPIDDALVMQAIELAQHAPSACNRQAVRIYAIKGNAKENLKDWINGVGGFEDSVFEYLLVTGVVSAYQIGERFQYIVSASIFAAYLTLALETLGIGSCMIQREVMNNSEWTKKALSFGIPNDEQIVCVIGIGQLLNKEYRVPISHRFSAEKIVKFIN